MINRIKAHLHVYAGHCELAIIILLLVIGGAMTGFALRGAYTTGTIAAIQVEHAREIERVNAENRQVLALLATRMGAMLQEQIAVREQTDTALDYASGAVQDAKAARKKARSADAAAKRAAAQAAAASKNAAQANITVTETPPEEAKPSPFPKRIEP